MSDEKWVRLADFLQRLEGFCGIGGMLLPVWNILWWLVGVTVMTPAIIVRLLRRQVSESCSSLEQIFYLPGTALNFILVLPLAYFAFPRAKAAKDRQKQEQAARNAARQEQITAATDFITARLAAAGIESEWHQAQKVMVFCDPSPDQIAAYRTVYADAVKRFTCGACKGPVSLGYAFGDACEELLRRTGCPLLVLLLGLNSPHDPTGPNPSCVNCHPEPYEPSDDQVSTADKKDVN